AIAGGEGAGLEPGPGEGVDEVLHHVRADHVGAVAGQPPARQVEALGDTRLARDAPGADVVAEGRRVGHRVALVAAVDVEQGRRAGPWAAPPRRLRARRTLPRRSLRSPGGQRRRRPFRRSRPGTAAAWALRSAAARPAVRYSSRARRRWSAAAAALAMRPPAR